MGHLELKDVRKSFSDVEVLKGLDLGIADGEFVIFVGPSGCGKSTLLRIIAGLEDLTGGEVYIDGREVSKLPPVRRGISMVFQSYALYPHLSVFENIAFPLRVERLKEKEVQKKVQEAARILQLEERLHCRPGALSGGQRQRVAIGRAIVRNPSLFLFDEPLSNLDAALRTEMRVELSQLHQDLGVTMIYVTHDQVEAMTMADRIVVLNEGEIAQVGTPLQLYNHPDNTFVARFIGSPKMNFLQGTLLHADVGSATVLMNCGQEITLQVATERASVGNQVTLGVRPEHVRCGPEGDLNIRLKPRVVEQLGIHTVLYGQLQDEVTRFCCLLDGTENISTHEEIEMSILAEDCHLFDADGKAFTKSAENMQELPKFG